MRLRPLCTAVLLACAAAPALHAQAVLRPGSGVSGARIVPRVDRLDVFVDFRAGGDPDAEYVMETLLADVGGRPAVVRRETMSVTGQVIQADSFVLERETLAPILLRGDGPGGGTSLNFSAGRVRGWTETEEGREKADVALSDRVFLAGSMDLVLGALPLADGYTAELALFDVHEGPTTARVRVAGLEDVATGGAPLRAWRVEVRGSGSAGTYWLREGTGALVQFVSADRSMRMVRRGAAGGRSAAR